MILMICTLFLIPKIGTSNWTLYLPVNPLTCQLVNLSPRYPVNLSTSLTNSANESILLEIFNSAANRGNIKT